MRPWLIDAKDITEIDNVGDFSTDLLFQNPSIRNYLHKTQHDLTFIAGPKGFGKTLILKLKRRLIQGSGFTFIPKNQLVDKPFASPAIMSFSDMSDLLENTPYWEHIWTISLSVAILKREDIGLTSFKSKELQLAYEDENLRSPCDLFDYFLSMSRRQYVDAYNDFRLTMKPAIRSFSSQVSVFIDNIDEYFEHATALAGTDGTIAKGSVAIWVYAQCGLVNAARGLNALNNHIKIWASIRSEAFEYLIRNDPMAAQIEGSSVVLTYQKSDLMEIFEKNVKVERIENLLDDGHDWKLNFFGKHALEIENNYAAETEEIMDYLLRHTMWRPRDLAIMGRAISEIPPDRRTEENISKVINERANFIAQSYLAESRVHMPELLPDILFSLIPTNILKRDELELISDKYNEAMRLTTGVEKDHHPFCNLFRLGLLGIVKNLGGNRQSFQDFPMPGQVGFLTENVLPASEYYLVHPVLVERIATLNRDFLKNIDDLNIVGNGRPWRVDRDIDFILKGDIAGFSLIMEDSDKAHRFPKDFKRIAERAEKKHSVRVTTSEGDALQIFGKNALKVLGASDDIRHDLRESVYAVECRFAGDAGLLRFENDTNKRELVGGKALRVAARLEPHVKIGETFVTDNFQKWLSVKHGVHKCAEYLNELEPSDIPNISTQDGKFDLSKSESDPAALHKLFKKLI